MSTTSMEATCPRCGLPIVVVSTKPLGNYVKRFHGCRKQRGGCGYRPEHNISLVTRAKETNQQPTR